MKPFRKYTVMFSYLEENTNKCISQKRVINLFEVDSWIEVDNESEGFKDKVKRTLVVNSFNSSFFFETSFDEFDSLMDEVLADARLLDDRADKKKEDPIPFEAKWKYKGDVKHRFKEAGTIIACSVLPVGYNPDGKTIEQILSKCIESNYIRLN